MDNSVATVRIGCAGLPDGVHRERYFEQLDFIELDNTFYTLPKQKLLNRWGENEQHFGLVAWQAITHPPGPKGYERSSRSFDAAELAHVGSFRDSPFVRAEVERLASAATTAGAEVVVFRTPPMWSPSAVNRDSLRRFFGDIATAERFGACTRVWQPDGLWELEPSADLAAELGVVMACDPLPQDPLAPPLEFFAGLGDATEGRAYFRLLGLGQARRLNEFNRERLLDLLEQFQTAWLVFDSPSKYHDARSVRKELRKRTSPSE